MQVTTPATSGFDSLSAHGTNTVPPVEVDIVGRRGTKRAPVNVRR
ncbi:hypothetical protein SEA_GLOBIWARMING_72 [Arthrobacter phage GlobiWarming]|nr:hypothetical protein SEA_GLOBIWARMING_72 [Arthrobacter phage GlobiWarming]